MKAYGDSAQVRDPAIGEFLPQPARLPIVPLPPPGRYGIHTFPLPIGQDTDSLGCSTRAGGQGWSRLGNLGGLETRDARL